MQRLQLALTYRLSIRERRRRPISLQLVMQLIRYIRQCLQYGLRLLRNYYSRRT